MSTTMISVTTTISSLAQDRPSEVRPVAILCGMVINFCHSSIMSDSFTAGFTYHSGGIPVVSESMVNPMLGKVVPVATATPAEEVVGGDQNLHVTTAVSSEAEVESSSTTTEPPAYKETSNCPPLTSRGPYRLTHQIPAGCDQSECDYFLGISSNRDNNDLLDFTLEGVAEGWIAVGFSKTPNMVREATACVVLPLF